MGENSSGEQTLGTAQLCRLRGFGSLMDCGGGSSLQGCGRVGSDPTRLTLLHLIGHRLLVDAEVVAPYGSKAGEAKVRCEMIDFDRKKLGEEGLLPLV